MDSFECFDKKLEFPLELFVNLSSYLIAKLRFVLLVEVVVIDELGHELFNAMYLSEYLLLSFRMSHSN
jgi:hypothetical protein